MNASVEKVDKKGIIISVVTGLVFALLGLVFFIINANYAEAGHDTLLFVYIALAILSIIPIYFIKKTVVILIVFMMVGTLGYAWAKFEWRSDYINSLKPFVLEAYIESYPTFEDHHFMFLSNNPQWVHFANDCYEPALKGEIMGENCRSMAMINKFYNINLDSIGSKYYDKMRQTAFMLEQGQLLNKEQYRRCLAAKRCAIIPLLPTEAAGRTIEETSEEYLEIRRQFWSLINNDEMSPEICEFIDLCRVMRDQNVIPIQKPSTE